MYLLPRNETAAPACKPTSLQTTASVLGYLGWASFFFLAAAFFWFNYKFQKAAIAAEQVQKERDSLALSVVHRISEIESLRADLDVSHMLLAIARAETANRRQDVFVVGDDSDSDSDSDSDDDGPGASASSSFSTPLQPTPAPAPTPAPTPTLTLTPILTPDSSERPGVAQAPVGTNADGETEEAQGDGSVPQPAGPEVSPLSQRSLAYELAVAQAGEDFGSETSSARPSAEVR